MKRGQKFPIFATTKKYCKSLLKVNGSCTVNTLNQKTLSLLASKNELNRSEIKLAERNNKQETGEQSGEKRGNGSAEFIRKSQASQIGIPSLKGVKIHRSGCFDLFAEITN